MKEEGLSYDTQRDRLRARRQHSLFSTSDVPVATYRGHPTSNTLVPADRITAKMSASDLENRADQLRAAKEYVDAYDFYRAALAKNPNSAVLYNKLGINELMSLHLREAKSDFERATHLNRQFGS